MESIFKKITLQLPKPLMFKVKLQLSLHAIVSDWCMEKNNEKIPLLNNQKLRNKITRERG